METREEQLRSQIEDLEKQIKPLKEVIEVFKKEQYCKIQYKTSRHHPLFSTYFIRMPVIQPLNQNATYICNYC